MTEFKAVPSVGDTVRVVLEGKVGQVTQFGFLVGKGPNANHFSEYSDHVKSVEIIEKARPSVKDLPVGSAIRDRDDDEVYVKVGANMPKPWASQWGTRHTDEQVGGIDWVQLVEKTDE